MLGKSNVTLQIGPKEKKPMDGTFFFSKLKCFSQVLY